MGYGADDEDWGDLGEEDEIESQRERDAGIMQERYVANKSARVNTSIGCAGCGKRMLKSSYQTRFCSNSGVGNCKDTYWNCVGRAFVPSGAVA